MIGPDEFLSLQKNPNPNTPKGGRGQKEYHNENGFAYTSNGWQAVNWGS